MMHSWGSCFVHVPYLAAYELGISTVGLSKRLGISQPAASQPVKRSEKIVKEKQLKVMG